MVVINSNLAAMRGLRRLNRASDQLGSAYTRLSTGLRINRASDDAAGLAISSSLSNDARVFAAGIRNLNDGISALSIAEGAVSELKAISIRVLELAEQSANGTLSRSQRQALQQESDALTREYDRIAATASFNGLSLLDGSLTNLGLQAGYGASGSLQISLGSYIARELGTGSFVAGATFAAGGTMTGLALEDFNGDGVEDILAVDGAGSRNYVMLGRGDGTFAGAVSYYGGGIVARTEDLNSDGHIDVVGTGFDGNVVVVSLGNGDGSLRAATLYATGARNIDARFADFNNGGIVDIAAAAANDSRVDILFGNGDGTFKLRVSYTTPVPGLTTIVSLQTGDVNSDGFDDFVASTGLGFGVYLNNGNGTFRLDSNNPTSTATSSGIELADLNYDGISDVIMASSTTSNYAVYLGNSNGTFKAGTVYYGGNSAFHVLAKDMNGDGALDLIQSEGGGAGQPISISFGNGDGSFKNAITSVVAGAIIQIAAGDLNGDGNNELLTTTSAESFVRIYNSGATERIARLERVNLASQETALEAIPVMRAALNRLNTELAVLGANYSRTITAASNLAQSRENYQGAASQILDADVATEAAELTRLQILQQSALGVLSQANQLPALALALLDG